MLLAHYHIRCPYRTLPCGDFQKCEGKLSCARGLAIESQWPSFHYSLHPANIRRCAYLALGKTHKFVFHGKFVCLPFCLRRHFLGFSNHASKKRD